MQKIGIGVFDGCSNVLVYLKAGSYAEQYCMENNIPYVSVEFAGKWAFEDSYKNNVEKVWFPDSCTAVREFAFASSERLTEVHIPASVTSIGQGAFRDCPLLTVVVAAGSYAEQYCQENQLEYVVEDVQ